MANFRRWESLGPSRPQEASDTLSAAYSSFNRVARNPRGGSRSVAGRGSRAATPASEDEFSSPKPRRRNRRSPSPVAARSRCRRTPSVEEIWPRARRAPPSLGPRSPDGYDRLGRIVDVLARQSAAERVLGPGANGPRSFWDDVNDLYRYAFLPLRFGIMC